MRQNQPISVSISRFIWTKRLIAAGLVPLFLFLAIYNLCRWLIKSNFLANSAQNTIQDINSILFDDFWSFTMSMKVSLAKSNRHPDRYLPFDALVAFA